MSRPDALRLSAALAQCDIALVLRDPVAPALLSQAARHAHGLDPGPLVAAAACLARACDPAGPSPQEMACRKVVQALVRAAAIDAEAALL
jgi:hypothetical protein